MGRWLVDRDERRNELAKRDARVWLLDGRLHDLFRSDPYVCAGINQYIFGEKTLESCLIELVVALVEDKNKMVQHALHNPIIKGDVK